MRALIITTVTFLIMFESYAQSKTDELPFKIFNSIEEAISSEKPVFGLSLVNKGLEKVPSEVYKMTELKYLNLSANKLELIPDSIRVLKNLEKLVWGCNGLNEVNETVSELKNLRGLFLFENNLSTLPKALSQLPMLENLVLYGNPFTRAEYDRLTRLFPNVNVQYYITK